MQYFLETIRLKLTKLYNSASEIMRIVEKSPPTIIDAPPTTQHYETPIYGASRIGVRYNKKQ